MPKLVAVHYTILIRVFEAEGFRQVRQKGDHVALTKAGIKRPVVIKTSPKRVPVTHIRTNMTTAGMSRERFFELLGQVSGKKPR